MVVGINRYFRNIMTKKNIFWILVYILCIPNIVAHPTPNAITEQEAKQIVVRYYNLLTEVSKTFDTKYGARDEIGGMFIHKDGWIFNDIEYVINKRPQEKGDPIDTYIISMYGNNLFGAQFSPTIITAIRKDNDWQINYNMHVYKQNVANYNISLLMYLDSAGKIRYIEKFNKPEEKFKKESLDFPYIVTDVELKFKYVDGNESKWCKYS